MTERMSDYETTLMELQTKVYSSATCNQDPYANGTEKEMDNTYADATLCAYDKSIIKEDSCQGTIFLHRFDFKI